MASMAKASPRLDKDCPSQKTLKLRLRQSRALELAGAAEPSPFSLLDTPSHAASSTATLLRPRGIVPRLESSRLYQRLHLYTRGSDWVRVDLAGGSRDGPPSSENDRRYGCSSAVAGYRRGVLIAGVRSADTPHPGEFHESADRWNHAIDA
jgi:hypothetical protein